MTGMYEADRGPGWSHGTAHHTMDEDQDKDAAR